jgi:predicted acetyltransferase
MGRLRRLEIFDAGRQPMARVGQPAWQVVKMSTCPRLASLSALPPAEEWPVVERLAQLERHDLSQFRGYVPRADGSYAFDGLDLFRADPGWQAWLIRYGLSLAGFALTRPLESGGTSMYAFFIVRGLRRHGVGLQAARELLRHIHGVWGIAFEDENADAQPFWERVATDAVGDLASDHRDGRRLTRR